MTTPTTPRGIRLNNPLNIRRNTIVWAGMAAEQDDPEFVTFKLPVWGVRAAARILINYFREGINTISGIIAKWAPPSENPTAAYIANVAQRTGLPADQPIHVPWQLEKIISAMIWQENGQQPYPDDLIDEAVTMAYSNVEQQ